MKIVDGHLASKLDDLMPWTYAQPVALKDLARKQRLRSLSRAPIQLGAQRMQANDAINAGVAISRLNQALGYAP